MANSTRLERSGSYEWWLHGSYRIFHDKKVVSLQKSDPSLTEERVLQPQAGELPTAVGKRLTYCGIDIEHMVPPLPDNRPAFTACEWVLKS